MRKRHFLCKEITDMQWEVTDGKVSEKDGHTDMERTGMKTAIKKGIKIYSPKIKKQKKGKGSLQAICKNKRRVFLCFFRKTRGKKQQIPAVLTVCDIATGNTTTMESTHGQLCTRFTD